MRAATVCLLAWVWLAACSQGPESGEATQPAPTPPPVGASAELNALRIESARVGFMQGMPHGAAYFTMHNIGPSDDRLLRVETDIAKVVEIHESLAENGVMRMVAHPDGLPLPAGGSVELAPGGKHIMLISPRLSEDGGPVSLTLHFEAAGPLRLEAPVVPPGT